YVYGVYTVGSNSCNSDTATVSVTYNSCVSSLIPDFASTTANTPASGNFLTNDGNPAGLVSSASPLNGPAHGTITIGTSGSYTYIPNSGFSGYDVVVVQVCDATPTCLTDTIYFTIIPNAVADNYSANSLGSNTTINGNVSVNDIGTGIAGNVSLINGVANGIIVLDTLGNFSYTPNSGYCGTDAFTYSVCDQNAL
ncbi:MAG: Ig-like domain-containing protein, partial [Bacteroidia bacterium]